MPDAGTGAPKRSSLVTGATGLALACTAIVHWQGYSYGGRGHSIHVPLVRWLQEPGLFALDPITDSFEGFATWFFHGAALVASAIGGVEPAFFVLYLVALALLVTGAWAFARTCFDDPRASALAVLLFVSMQPSLGGGASHWNGLTHASFTAGGLVWSLALYVSGRRLLAWGLVGLLFNLHALSAFYVAAMLGVDGLLRLRERGARELLAGVGICALVSMPTLVWVLASAYQDRIESLPRWLRIMRERSSHHAFPLSTSLGHYGRYAMLLCLGWLGLRATRSGPLHRHVRAFAIAVALLCAAGLVFAEWIPIPMVIRAQLLRSTKWLAFPALAGIAALAATGWDRGGAARVAGVLAFAGVMLREPTWLALSLVLLLFTERPGPLVTLAGALSIVVAAAGDGIRPPAELGLSALAVHFESLVEGPAALVCLAGWLTLRALKHGIARTATAAVLVLACLGWLLPGLYQSGHSSRRTDTWKQLQDWARESTSPHALFLTPPGETGFRIFSERGTVGEWKDGTQQFFANAWAVGWWERMHALGGQAEGFHQKNQQQLLEVGRRYGATHVVRWVGTPLELPKLYENGDWIVYELRELPPDLTAAPAESEASDR